MMSEARKPHSSLDIVRAACKSYGLSSHFPNDDELNAQAIAAVADLEEQFEASQAREADQRRGASYEKDRADTALARLHFAEAQFEELHRLAHNVRDSFLVLHVDDAQLDAACHDLDAWLTAYDWRADGSEDLRRGGPGDEGHAETSVGTAADSAHGVDRPATPPLSTPVSLPESLGPAPAGAVTPSSSGASAADGNPRVSGAASYPSRESEAYRTDGAGLIATERQRQIDSEGWDAGHDDAHDQSEMAKAAAAYAIVSYGSAHAYEYWPWHPDWWRPTDRIGTLVKAGALIAAEIDRLQRASSPAISLEASASTKSGCSSDATDDPSTQAGVSDGEGKSTRENWRPGSGNPPPASSPAKCPDCKGYGMTDVETGAPARGKTVSTEECFTCDGTGKVLAP